MQNAAPLEYDTKPCEASFSNVFFRCSFQPEVVSDVISGMIVQDVGVHVRANFDVFRLKPSEASYSALFRTSITSDRKYTVMSYPV